MMEREIELDMFEDFLEIGQDTIEKCVISKNDIAIVGLSVRAGAADGRRDPQGLPQHVRRALPRRGRCP